MRKTKYAVDQNEIQQYFPVQHVVDSVLGIYQELLGVRFARVDVPVWQSQVQAYERDRRRVERPLGRFYLDLFPRPGKYDHFANFPLVPRRVLPDGSVRLAESAIVGNWPQPAPGKPALLTHGDVETFFHEFGHNMAAMLADGAVRDADQRLPPRLRRGALADARELGLGSRPSSSASRPTSRPASRCPTT